MIRCIYSITSIWPKKESCSKMQAVLQRSTILDGYNYINSDYGYMKSLQITAHSWFVWEIPTNHKNFVFLPVDIDIIQRCKKSVRFNTLLIFEVKSSPLHRQSWTKLQITWNFVVSSKTTPWSNVPVQFPETVEFAKPNIPSPIILQH